MAKPLIIFLLFLFPLVSQSQSVSALNDSLVYYYNNDQLSKALPLAKKIVELSKTNYGEQDNRYAGAINNLAFILEKTGNDQEAEMNYRIALSIRSAILQSDHEDLISSVQNLVFLYIRKGEFEKAEPVGDEWLNSIVNEGKENSVAGARSWWLNGLLHVNMNQHRLAEKELLRSLSIQDSLNTDSSLLLNTLKTLVEMYSSSADAGKGENIFKRYVELSKITDGPSSEQYIYNVYQLSGFYGRGNQFLTAEKYLREVLDFYRNKKGKTSTEYFIVAQNFSKLHAKLGWKKSSDSIANEIIITQKEKYGSASVEYADALIQAGRIFLINGNTEEAEKRIAQGVATVRPLNNPALLESYLSTLDSVFKLQQKTIQRFPVLNEIISLNRQYHLLSDSTLCFRLVELAIAHYTMGNYRQSMSFLDDIDTTATRGFLNDPELFVLSKKIIASVYLKMDLLSKAGYYYSEALRIAPKIWSQDDINYIGLLADMGVFYDQSGQRDRAEQFILKAIYLIEKKSPDDPFRTTLYSRLAGIYDNNKKDEAKKEEALTNAVNAARTQLPYSHTKFIESLGELADFYAGKYQFEKAEKSYLQIYDITKDSSGTIFEKGLVARMGIATIAYKSGAPGRAATIVDEIKTAAALQHHGNEGWSESLEVALMQYYQLTSQYDKAEFLAEKLSEKSRKSLGEDNPSYAFQLIVEASLYLQSGNYLKAEKTVALMNRVALKNMREYFEGLTEKEKNNYLQSRFFITHTANTLILKSPKVSDSFIRENYEVLLLLKSLTLSETRNITESVLQSKDSSLLVLYESWLANRRLIAKEQTLPVALQSDNLEARKEMAEKQEKDIAKRSVIFRDQQKAKNISISDIQDKLSEDEASIEFVNFAVLGEKEDTGTYAMYGAYILTRKSAVPVFVPLCRQTQLDKIFDSTGGSAIKMADRFYRGLELKNKSVSGLGKDLYGLVWAPLEPYLQGIKTISYSPAGKLYSIAFHALPIDSVSVLMDKYKLVQYSTTRTIATRSPENELKLPKTISLFGDARFTMDSAGLVIGKHTGIRKNDLEPVIRGTNGSSWNDLPGTATEIKRVKELFQSKNIQAGFYTGIEASEENLKSLSGHSPNVIHIATHGFFLTDPEKTNDKLTAELNNKNAGEGDPLLRSGLILAGANYVWSGNIPIDGIEDGIVTAYEISQLDLSNTELIVLSACETALGDVKGSEGVFGLQRAFKMAGVKKMIVSLWQVPDKETAELMTAFYGYWLKGNSISDAFGFAQKELRKKYPAFYWAAFVLVE